MQDNGCPRISCNTRVVREFVIRGLSEKFVDDVNLNKPGYIFLPVKLDSLIVVSGISRKLGTGGACLTYTVPLAGLLLSG